MHLNNNGYFFIFSFLLFQLICRGNTNLDKNKSQKAFIVKNNISRVDLYERNCHHESEILNSKTLYNEKGEVIETVSYHNGDIFSKSTFEYKDGILVKKTNHPGSYDPLLWHETYAYDENGLKSGFERVDGDGKILLTGKIERKVKMEIESRYDAKGKETGKKTTVLDFLDNPVVSGSNKYTYKYNKDGNIVDSYMENDQFGFKSGSVFEYKGLLPVKQTFYTDTCHAIIRYEYTTASGEKWNK